MPMTSMGSARAMVFQHSPWSMLKLISEAGPCIINTNLYVYMCVCLMIIMIRG